MLMELLMLQMAVLPLKMMIMISGLVSNRNIFFGIHKTNKPLGFPAGGFPVHRDLIIAQLAQLMLLAVTLLKNILMPVLMQV